MFLIEALQYLTFYTPNVAAMSAYYKDGLGLTELEQSGEEQVYLAAGSDQPALILKQSDHIGLGKVGFRVRGEQAWATVRKRLSEHQIPYDERDDALFGPTLSFQDRDGHPLHLHLTRQKWAVTDAPRTGPQVNRLQHITYASPNPRQLARFYEDVLGLRTSDLIETGHFIWLRTDSEHHTVAMAAHREPGLDHYAFELPDWASFKSFCDFLATKNIAVVWGPGRHGAGNNLFFFTLDPDGHRVEFSAEMEKFYDEHMTYTPRVWKQSAFTVNLWGQGAPWERQLPDE